MRSIDLVVETPVSKSMRARQVSAMFDVPMGDTSRVEWHGKIDVDERPWNVGLVVGPSGCGKSSIMRDLWGDMPAMEWGAASVIDDFATTASVQQVADVCGAVGFNTIPAWLRPFRVLSNGEQFRVDLARRLLELPDPIVVDEFTSVVDRQVAKIGAHAVAKAVRKNGRKFVAVSCHYDIVDWLQPDWILEPATMTLTWRSLQRRPTIEAEIRRCEYSTWAQFAPYHYLSADLHTSARCYALYVGGRSVAFAGMLHRPHPTAHDIMGCSRLVTLPDWQGVGLAFALIDAVAGAYNAIGKRTHTYPAHPALSRAFDRSPLWRMHQAPGKMAKLSATARTATRGTGNNSVGAGRPCAVFEYVGPAMADAEQARAFIAG